MKISEPLLAITVSGKKAIINVTYQVTFTPFERFLASNGLAFKEVINVLGIDRGESRTISGLPDINGDILYFVAEYIDVTPGTETLTIARNRSLEFGRNNLREDRGYSNDEIKCRIIVTPEGIPIKTVVETNMQALAMV
jgi:hypothetical protein